MRIDRLDLAAYGCFTNAVLDFAETGRNMVVVYGDNEAGKSTALDAIRHWLFGFDKATEKVAFIHKPASLRIRGTMSDAAAGTALNAIRRKGNKDTLLDVDGKTPLKEGAFDPFLKSITAKQFEESFGLNLEQLKAGGQDLAAGKGNLGAALFAAASGVVNLQKLRSAIAARKEALFSATAYKRPINADISAYKEAKKTWEDSLVPAAKATELESDVSECRAVLAAFKARSLEATAARDRLSRLQRGRPLLLKFADLQRQREPLRGVVPLDASFAARHTAILEEYRKREAQMATLDERLRVLDEEIADIVVDESILAVTESVTRLAARQQSVKKLDTDLTADEQLVHSKLGEAKQTLRGLGLPVDNPESYLESLRLNDREKKLLRRLATESTKLTESIATAERTRTEKQNDWQVALGRIEAIVEPVATVGLVAAIEEVNRAGDLDASASTLRHEVEVLSKEIESMRKRLGYSRPIGEITATAVPSLEVIGHHRDTLDAIDREMADLRKRQRELEAEILKAEHELARADAAHAIPRPEDLPIAREHRDAGWSLIRRAWLSGDWDDAATAHYAGEKVQSEGLARSYAAAVTASDGVADRLTAEADRVRDRRELALRLQSLRQRMKLLESDVTRTAELREDSLAQWHAIWTAIQVATASPREMIDWRNRWDTLCDRVGAHSAMQSKLSGLNVEIDTRRDLLRRAVIGTGENSTLLEGITRLGELATFAKLTLKRHDQTTADRLLREQKGTDTANAAQAADLQFKTKKAERTEWELEWATATTHLALAGLSSLRADQFEDVLDGIDEFYKHMNFRRGRLIDMEKRKADRADWRTEMSTLAEQLGDLVQFQSASDPTPLCIAWTQRLKLAEAARALLSDRTEQRAGLREQRPDLATELATAKDLLECLVVEARAGTAAALPHCIVLAAELREIDRRIEAEYREPLRDLAAEAGCSAEEVERQVAEATGLNLESEIETVKQNLAELDPQRDEAARKLGQTERTLAELLGRRGGIDERERLEAALARIRQTVPDYATLVLAEAVLARAIDRYRERNKSELFETASRLFGRLTCGRFAGLEIERDENDEQFLVGVRPDGVTPERVTITGMSDGTQDQLYLALRLAHLEKHVTDHGPFPIIIDDLLLAFDDARARAALECLTDLSCRTQVVFFTHHRHLRDMASESVFQRQIGILELLSLGKSVANVSLTQENAQANRDASWGIDREAEAHRGDTQ